jgi:hypothetical protein
MERKSVSTIQARDELGMTLYDLSLHVPEPADVAIGQIDVRRKKAKMNKNI